MSTDNNKGRVITCVFRIEDEEKFQPVWDSIRNNVSVLGARLTTAKGDRMKEMERELNVWQHLQDSLVNDRRFDELWDDLWPKHNWGDTSDWDIARCVSEIAKVWQPEEGCL